MEENQDKKKNNKLVAVIATATLLMGVIGATYAYFAAQIGDAKTANVTLTTKTTDTVTFSTGSAISNTATQQNFYEGAGDLTIGTTTAQAQLKANNSAAVATNTYCYLAYYTITNGLAYTVNSSTPEVVMTVTKKTNTNSAVTVYQNVDVTTAKTCYFPKTNASGTLSTCQTSAIKHTFVATSAGATTTDLFNITVVFKNLSTDQQANTNKQYKGVVHIENVAC